MDMTKRFLQLLGVFLCVAPTLVLMDSRPCDDGEDCVWWSIVEQNDKDTCCFGKCEEGCPGAVFLAVLFFIILPIVCCIACAGGIALVVYCAVKQSNKNASTAGAVYNQVPPNGYPVAAYPPYSATNYGFTAPGMPEPPVYSSENVEEAGKN